MPMPVKSYRDLVAWQRGIELVIATYEMSQLLPKWEQYDLASQMRRAAVSVPSNIAEGHSRSSRREYAHSLSIVLGSLSELETLLVVSERVGYVKSHQLETVRGHADEVGRMVRAIQRGLRV